MRVSAAINADRAASLLLCLCAALPRSADRALPCARRAGGNRLALAAVA
jgi:hypothetical protein